jgi:hypothetical protein
MQKGRWLRLKYQEHDIAIHWSRYRRIETIYVNNHPISEKPNFWGASSVYKVTLAEQPFYLHIESPALTNVLARATLKKGGQQLVSADAKYFETRASFVKYLCFVLAMPFAGFLLGITLSKVL